MLGVEHVNILPLYGYTYGFGPFPALVSPWAENGTLEVYVERQKLTMVDKFNIVSLPLYQMSGRLMEMLAQRCCSGRAISYVSVQRCPGTITHAWWQFMTKISSMET
jgi:hypothetical protein